MYPLFDRQASESICGVLFAALEDCDYISLTSGVQTQRTMANPAGDIRADKGLSRAQRVAQGTQIQYGVQKRDIIILVSTTQLCEAR